MHSKGEKAQPYPYLANLSKTGRKTCEICCLFFFFPPFCFYFLFLLLGSLPLCSMPERVRAMSTGLWQGRAETRTSQGGMESRRQAELFERTLLFLE